MTDSRSPKLELFKPKPIEPMATSKNVMSTRAFQDEECASSGSLSKEWKGHYRDGRWGNVQGSICKGH
jgi:hypothetical protein